MLKSVEKLEITVHALAASIVDTMTRLRPRVSARKPQICDEKRMPVRATKNLNMHANETTLHKTRHTDECDRTDDALTRGRQLHVTVGGRHNQTHAHRFRQHGQDDGAADQQHDNLHAAKTYEGGDGVCGSIKL